MKRTVNEYKSVGKMQVLIVGILLFLLQGVQAQSVLSVSPATNNNQVAKEANIVMTFSTSVTLSASNMIVTGSQTGVISGAFSNNGTTTVTFDPTSDFKLGELITVQLTTGTGLLNPYNFSFRVQPTSNVITGATPVQKNTISTVSKLIDVASGDLDGDGDIDLIAVSHTTSELIWFQNDGAAVPSFTAQPALYDGADTEELISVVLGDMDNDGDLDIFFGAEIADKVFFIKNNGGGTFGAVTEINSGTADGLTTVFLGDVNGDGLVDVLASSAADNTIAWYKNNNGTGFGSETIISNSLGGAFSIKVGDMDGDGDLDVIGAAATGDEILWYPNNGDGTFGSNTVVGASTDGVHSISVGDLDGDGDLDVASAHLEEDSILWYENTGSGASFTERTVYHDASGTNSDRAINVDLKDLDGDGDLDILWAADVVPVGSGNVAWSRNDGGSPISWTYLPVDATVTRGYSVDAADLDGNGTLEFIGTALGHAGGTGTALSWYKLDTPVFVSATPSVNSTNAATDANIGITFTKPVTLSANNTFVTGSQTGMISGTFSNNGTTTVTFDPTSDFKPGELITVQLTTGTGMLNPYNFSFRIQPSSSTITPASTIQKNTISIVSKLIDVASGDLDGDGDIDLIAVSHATSELIWFQNDGATQPSFTAQTALYDGVFTEELISVVLGDANNDGDLDIFFGANQADKIFFIENNGNGTFKAATQISAFIADGLSTVFLGDLDGDGFIDVLASSQNDNTLAWYKGNGDNTFGSETLISNSLGGAYSVKVGDMDNDGDLDVIGAALSGDEIRWYANDGSGVFSTNTLVASTYDGASSISVGDIDGDGDLDIAATALNEDRVSWFENTGSGASFTERTIYHDASGTSSDRAINIDLKDLDGDGDLDILWAADVVPIGSGNIAWSRNDGGSPVNWTYIPVNTTAYRGYSVDAADLTGDGKLEFIGTALGNSGGTGAALSWYKLDVPAFLSVTPSENSTTATTDANIAMTFNKPVTLSANNTIVTGSQTGMISGTFSNNGTTAVTFDPTSSFKRGELITVQLTAEIGLSNPYNFSFRVQPSSNLIQPESPVQKNTISTVSKLIDVASGDLDGDGDIDLIAVSHTTSELIWFQNDGAAQPSFTAQPALYDGADTEELISVVLGDANNDGDLDIFFGAEIADKVFFIENKGNGTFGTVTEINSGTADGLTTVFLGDLDSDGFIDILASSAADNTLAWYKGNGDNTFGSETIISSSLGGAFSVKAGDMDGDGDLDVIGAAATGDEIVWYPNNGTGGFGLSKQVGIFTDGVWSISVGDIDGDGDLDVAATTLNEDKVLWFENTGIGGNFTERTVYHDASGTSSDRAINIDLKDMDGDGDLDILWAADVVPIGSGNIAWSRNDGGSPISWTYIPVDATAHRGYSVDAADLTGDGKLEFIGAALGDAGGTGAALSWYKLLDVLVFASATPSVNSTVVATDANIEITFTKPVTLSANNTIVTGSQTGLISGTFSNNGTTTVTFDPATNFKPGELITVQLTTAIGLFNPYNFSFRVQPANNEITAAMSVQKNTISTVLKLIDVASGDLDGDGDIDLIAVSHTTSELIWFQNDGAAQPTFTAQPALYDGADTEELISVVLGDANNDGDLDIFFGAEIADKVFFIENNGDGTFEAATQINAGTADGLTTVFLGDLDSDGFIDILASSAADNTLAWYKGNGDNTFGSETIISSSLGGAFSVKVGDMDGDGDLDVIGAALSVDEIRWYANDGSGVFSTNTLVASAYDEASSISVGDIDGDGDLDIAATALLENKVSWYENTGAGASFTERTVYHDASGNSSNRAINVDIKDMDGDGDLDILWAADVQAGTGGAIGTLSWSRNDGGSPVSWTYLPVDATATRGYSVDAADLTGDGKLEFIGTALGDAGGTGAALSWYTLLDAPAFASATPSVNSTTVARDANIVMTFTKPVTLSVNNTIVMGSQTAKITGTFSNNGTTTVTFDPGSNFKPGELITVQLTTGTGMPNPYSFSFRAQPASNQITTSTPIQKNVVSTKAGLIDVASGDLDGDGDIDLIAVSHTTSELIWFQNDGAAVPSFTAQPALYDGADTEELISVVLGDANNDGDLDIFFGAEIADKVFFIENNGDGTFEAATQINAGTADGLTTVFLGDLDGDGFIDILASSAADNTLAWYKGNGDNTFGSETIIGNLGGAYSVKVGDMDNDGDLDVIGAAFGSYLIRWYANNGSGVFGTFTSVSNVLDGASSISVGDIDGDGDLDIAATALLANKVVWYENTAGDGSSFTERIVFNSVEGSERAVNVDLKDLDGDGDLDILWAADERPIGQGTIAFSRNDGGSPISWTYIPVDATAYRGYSVDAADLTGDGKLEFIGTALGDSGTGAALSWHTFNLLSSLSIKVYLTGPFDISSGMMNDHLRVNGIIPTSSPYGDGATCNASVFSVTGNDAIVDWVLVELRDKDNINTVVATQGALLQRDGDVVGTDGSSTVSFAVAEGDYYVSVTHRNHINIVSDQAISFATPPVSLDLTQESNVRGGLNGVNELMTNVYGLFPGDIDANNSVQTTDRIGLIGAIGQSGYSALDVNMNGQIQTTDLGLLTSFIGKGIQF